ncbi:MAG: TauD/TfdA family dioxygenase [Ktedonobacteraceae bacterium]|nr:TauD/TfdA family dioxygenase [Ktedonobacteraceae bacterium]
MINVEIPPIGEECVTTLTNEEQSIIKSCGDTLPRLDPSRLDDDSIFTSVGLARRAIPQRLAAKLIDFRRNSNDYGTLFIRNLPVDRELPPTPGNEKILFSKTPVSEYNLLLLMTYLGEPIAYADEKEGMIIQNIVPVPGNEDKQENTGSVFLEFHTEDGFHPYKPDYVGLLCLRSDHDHQAVTATASIRRALHKIPDHLITHLREPLYEIRLCSSFLKDGRHASYSPLMPILRGDTLEPELCIDFHAMRAVNEEAKIAFEGLKAALLGVLVGQILLPGDMIIIDNRVAAHARTAFQPRYDENDRWLQRMFVVEDFRRSQPGRPQRSHVCRPLTW